MAKQSIRPNRNTKSRIPKNASRKEMLRVGREEVKHNAKVNHASIRKES